eukprot:1615061-Karenia_brevis.AAC.1
MRIVLTWRFILNHSPSCCGSAHDCNESDAKKKDCSKYEAWDPSIIDGQSQGLVLQGAVLSAA